MNLNKRLEIVEKRIDVLEAMVDHLNKKMAPMEESKCEHDILNSHWIKKDEKFVATHIKSKEDSPNCPFCNPNKLAEILFRSVYGEKGTMTAHDVWNKVAKDAIETIEKVIDEYYLDKTGIGFSVDGLKKKLRELI